MSDFILIVSFFVFWFLQKKLKGFCIKKSLNARWTPYLYIFVTGSIGTGYTLLIKNGWLQKIGLEESDYTVFILAVIIFYWAFSLSKVTDIYKQD